MFNKHPKGLIAAALANLGERFGFYTMMAILVLFLQAKFGMMEKKQDLFTQLFIFLFTFWRWSEVLLPIKRGTTKELFSQELC